MIDAKPKDFKIGEVYKMDVGRRSHTNNPYYVIIKNVCSYFIETTIPEHHSLEISERNGNWEYQTKRMTYIGNDEKSRKLAYNQKGLLTYAKK